MSRRSTAHIYLAVILDLFSRRVVGWATSETNDAALAIDALHIAAAHRNRSIGFIHHSDRGSVYGSADYRKALDNLGATKSMSRRANFWDNAVAESFFGTIKGECLDHQTLATNHDAHATIADYFDGFYNVSRLHFAIGYMSPIEFELRFQIVKQAGW